MKINTEVQRVQFKVRQDCVQTGRFSLIYHTTCLQKCDDTLWTERVINTIAVCPALSYAGYVHGEPLDKSHIHVYTMLPNAGSLHHMSCCVLSGGSVWRADPPVCVCVWRDGSQWSVKSAGAPAVRLSLVLMHLAANHPTSSRLHKSFLPCIILRLTNDQFHTKTKLRLHWLCCCYTEWATVLETVAQAHRLINSYSELQTELQLHRGLRHLVGLAYSVPCFLIHFHVIFLVPFWGFSVLHEMKKSLNDSMAIIT